MDSPCSPARVEGSPTVDAPVVVIGAGPGGLTAALQLAELGVPVLVVEAGPRVGGLAQTVVYKGFRFDIGGHRFFTKVRSVRELWRQMLGPDFLRRPRLSRIFFQGRFFDYPLKPVSTLRKLGPIRSLAILFSYLWSSLRPVRPEVSFEDWVTNRFGRRLFRMFFETYTEKVWGIPCRSISARWAAQRIQGLSVRTAVLDMAGRWIGRTPSRRVKTLTDEFEYPRLGPGMMWEAFAARIEALGGSVLLNARVIALAGDGGSIQRVAIEREGTGVCQPAAAVISTMALSTLVESLGPTVPHDVKEAARGLAYRDFIMVALIVDHPHLFPDNWIYVHDPAVKVGRIQNFKNWSAEMVPDPSKTCLGLEYFCTEGDGLWALSDDRLVALAKAELGTIGLADPRLVVDATVVRVPKAYPVYDEHYADALQIVRRYAGTFRNLQTIGRNGTHTYNNQDHSMVMAMLAVRNLFGETHDLWAVDSQDDYLEELDESGDQPSMPDERALASTQRLFPTLVRAQSYEPR
jgi:protoporphyrinogen oxidase